uniref:ShKT domain-containing protein n=1 Tax=Elaeophora elaphi TaxID=1147741 RepID=A0A0R3RGG0_9BILA
MWFLPLFIFPIFVTKPTFGQSRTNEISARFIANCDQAPTLAIRTTCLNLQRMANNSRRNLEQQAQVIIHPPGIPEHLRPGMIVPGSRGLVASNPYDCMTLTCLCPYFSGRIDSQNQCVLRNGQLAAMAYRKEYRLLTEDERLRYHNALNMLKQSGEYDRISMEHRLVGAGGGAHSGPGFLPWHREYIKRFEIALRLIDPSVSLPYWDSVLDSYLPNPADSIFFSPIFMGETDFFGNVVNGPFAYWSTLDGRNAIMRNFGQEGQLFTEWNLQQVMQQSSIENILSYTAPTQGCPYPVNYGALEYSHSNVHLWVGGHMKPPEQSSNDPIFFSHHAFVDFIWELWRQNMQSAWTRELDYPPDISACADPLHFSYALMRPFFTLYNRDGLSNMYTDQMYRYAPRPGCTSEIPSCGTPYLFCDTRGIPHCVSKIKLNGLCIGFEGFDACFNGICRMGRCIPGATPAPFVPQMRLSQMEQTAISQAQIRRSFVDCFNRHPCCEAWANMGECKNNRNYMRQYCRAACRICNPKFNSSNECTDRHIACGQWSGDGKCRGDSDQFMEENCRQSCHFCNTPKNTSCPIPALVIFILCSSSSSKKRNYLTLKNLFQLANIL